jgi:hypothetical protein
MTLPISNLSFSAIQTEFGGTNPISLSEYYKGGAYVNANTVGSIPTSGAISLSQFLGRTQGVNPTYSLLRSVSSVNEPGNFTITFSTNQSGSFAYTISGVNSADIAGASLTGTVSNGNVLTYSVTADNATENAETFTIALDNGLASASVVINDTSIAYPLYGTVLSQGCVAYGVSPYTYRVTKANGSGGSFNEDTPNSTSCGYVAPPVYGTYLYQFCSGVDLYYVYADGSGGSYYSLYQANSPTCGYVAPVPPSSATWSVGYSNSGTSGPISVFVLVTLNRAATVSTTYTFTGVVVQNGVAFTVPSVTIGVGSTSSNPSSFSGVYNGSGPYVPITLRVTPSSVPYPLTPSGSIDTSFQYSA